MMSGLHSRSCDADSRAASCRSASSLPVSTAAAADAENWLRSPSQSMASMRLRNACSSSESGPNSPLHHANTSGDQTSKSKLTYVLPLQRTLAEGQVSSKWTSLVGVQEGVDDLPEDLAPVVLVLLHPLIRRRQHRPLMGLQTGSSPRFRNDGGTAPLLVWKQQKDGISGLLQR